MSEFFFKSELVFSNALDGKVVVDMGIVVVAANDVKNIIVFAVVFVVALFSSCRCRHCSGWISAFFKIYDNNDRNFVKKKYLRWTNVNFIFVWILCIYTQKR